MESGRATVYVLGAIAGALVGVFILVGVLLPAERVWQVERNLCHPEAAVYEALSQPDSIVRWFFPETTAVEILEDRVRWTNDDRWLELRIVDRHPPTAVDYELVQEGRFAMPLGARLESISDPDSGSRLAVTGHGVAETLVGRWFMVAPDVLARVGLPHQSFEDALDLTLARLNEHLDEVTPGCPES